MINMRDVVLKISVIAIAAIGLLAVSSAVLGDNAAPAASPASPATATPSSPDASAVSADVDRILRRTEKAGDEVRRLMADFEYHYFKRLIRAEEWLSGNMVFQQPSNFLIRFVDGEKQTFRFNGRMFVEDRPLQMQRNVYRLRADDEPPVDSIAINRTPFPLPFGQKRDDVLKNFEVEYRGLEALEAWRRPDKPQQKVDERKYERLVLIPRKESPLSKDYTRLDFWIDGETGLPKQIRTQDESKAVLTVRFGPLSLNDNVKVDAGDFNEPGMPGGGWKRIYEDMSEKRPSLPAER